jgi:hypothetical protein
MSYAAEDFPDYPGFAEKYNEMNRSDRKAEMKRNRHELLYGNDSAMWHTIDENGNRVSDKEWYIRMPSDSLTSKLVQAQNNRLAIISERRKCEKDSQRYMELTGRIAIYDEKINVLQEQLNGFSHG